MSRYNGNTTIIRLLSPSHICHVSILLIILLINGMSTMQRLSEYGLRIGGLCGQLSEEYQLQYSGWCTALANCDAIIKYVLYLENTLQPIYNMLSF